MKFVTSFAVLLAAGFFVGTGSSQLDTRWLSSHQQQFVRAMKSAETRRSVSSEQPQLVSRLLQAARPASTNTWDADIRRSLEEYQDFNVNLTQYALKYLGCSNIHTYSDDLAQDEDATSVLAMKRFVVVRLCPTKGCSSYHHNGCNYGFGDYLLPMEDYLQTMAYNHFAQFEEYCNTCYQCMKKEEQAQQQQQQQGDDGQQAAGDDAWQQQQQQGDDGWQQQDDAVQDDDANNNRRRLEDDDYYYKGADFYNAMDGDDAAQDYQCEYSEVCSNFRSACKEYGYTQQASSMQEFFECQKVNIGNNGGNIYLGPHCRSDGRTIGIGMHRDEECNVYNSDMIDISSYTGLDLDDEYLQPYYTESCISCLASDGYDLEESDSVVNQVCGAMYESSAKCNRHMGNDEIYSDNQEETENEVCTFIENLITNKYDEYGEIVLSNGWHDYVPDVRTMTQFQKYAMSISVLLVVGMSAYACFLRRTIKQRKFTWHPRMTDPYGVSGRTHSGIIQGRSFTGREFDIQGGTYA